MFDKYNIVAILTAWKRDYFNQQITALLNQTIKPDLIVIFNNGNLDLSHHKKTFGEQIKIINSELNTKYWGRFAIANLFNTDYILLMDDDTIPASRWVENCLRLHNEKNCIVTANGRSVNDDDNFGDGGNATHDRKAAFGGHSWFFKKEWLKYFITEKPLSYLTGEDISFCALCKIKGGIETWVAKQGGETSADTIFYADDEHASYRLNDWSNIRINILKHFQNKGWVA